jgi:hypothetical protein
MLSDAAGALTEVSREEMKCRNPESEKVSDSPPGAGGAGGADGATGAGAGATGETTRGGGADCAAG